MPTDITIRPAERRDLEALGRLGASLMRLHHAFDERRFLPPGDDPESGYAHFLGTQLDSSDSVVLLAERAAPGHAAVAIGYVYASVEPLSWKELRAEAGFIHDLLIAEDARRSGVGHQLLEAAIAWLRKKGMPRVVLWTASSNDGARKLFERQGFRSTMVEMTMELD